MHTIHRYIAAIYLISLGTALLVFTFVMSLGAVIKATDLLARGVSWAGVGRIILYGLPQALTFSIPVSALTSSLLVFGRLSSDGETTAMRACGISMRQIVRTPVLVAAALTAVCLHLNDRIAPTAHYARRLLGQRLGVESPLDLLEEGKFVDDFSGLTIYVGARSGNRLEDVRVYDLRRPDRKREMLARRGRLNVETNGNAVVLDLFDVRIDDPLLKGEGGVGFCRHLPIRIPIGPRSGPRPKRDDDLTLAELVAQARDVGSHYPALDAVGRRRQEAVLRVELHKRLALSLSCISFVLLGVPLGVVAHRKESSAGVGMSLVLMFVFYLCVIVAGAMSKHPELRPHLIVWVPVVVSVGLGGWLIRRSD